MKRFFLANEKISLIETIYFNNQIMFLKCLNNIIYLSYTYMCLLNLIHEMIYTRYFYTVYGSVKTKHDFKFVVAVCRAHQGLPVGFLLLRYSVLFTVESLSLLYLLVISLFLCSKR